ncbi:hypothetical protein [Aliarcobacter cryaerophilus]|uniref:AAA+ ATPase domain-containing protein n=1 Tax=Aliarcobacter cryaerophilus TaxID=28198 RepID=A0A2S9TR96_9BACT|nr:hypothetical protein [Aliarcobacter cryaerophilus]PRN01362.1 hypothetical protein CJ668_02525 [Arcobacter cryaerophilus gv. pseudocryaerophilus]
MVGININLNSSQDAQIKKDDELIQQDSKNRLIKIFKEHRNLLDNTNIDKLRVHNSILINGKRGFGKTTFILSMIELLKEEKSGIKDFHFFDIIDPTIIETKENIFILVLSKIVEALENCKRNSDYRDEEYKELKNLQIELAKGIDVLDGIGGETQFNQHIWSEPELVLEQGLRSVKGGSKLEENFKKYIKKALEILSKKAFVVVFDDIDTATNQGKMILELIRKYFTTPQLIIVMLGDIELYNLIARELQWKKMSPEYTQKFDKESISKLYSDEIDNLTNQYILKLIKPENKIDLKTLYMLNSEKNHERKLTVNDENLDNLVIRFIKDFFKETSSNKISIFKFFLLNQAIRTFIVTVKPYVENNNDIIDILQNFEYTYKTQLSLKYNTLELANLLNSFRLKSNNSYFLLYKYLKKLQNEYQEFDRIDFLPNSTNDDINILNTLLNSHIAYATNNFTGIFNMYIKFYLPISFKNMDYSLNGYAFKTARYIIAKKLHTSDLKDVIGVHKIHIADFKEMNLSSEQQAIFNMLYVGVFKNKKLNNYISFWNILGFLGSILEKDNFKKLLQAKSYSFDDDLSEDNEIKNDIFESEYNINELSKFDLVDIDLNLSTSQLNSIWIRIEYCVRYINNNKEGGLGTQFHRYIVAMLNAFIVVVLEKETEIDFRNALSFDNGINKIYDNNLKILESKESEYKNLYRFIKADFWDMFIFLYHEHINNNNLKIVDKLNSISIIKSIKEEIEDIVYSLTPVTIDRYEALKNGNIYYEEFKKLKNSISSKMTTLKIGNSKQIKIFNYLESMWQKINNDYRK